VGVRWWSDMLGYFQGRVLVDFMIDHDVGVAEESRYILKKIDLDYFNED